MSICINALPSTELYRIAKFYGIVQYAPARVSESIDYSSLFNGVKTAADLYQTMKMYRLANIVKSDSYPTFEDVRLPSILHMSSIDMYKMIKPGMSSDTDYITYQSSIVTYLFYKYAMFGREFKPTPILLDSASFLSRAILRENSSAQILPSELVYKYYKAKYNVHTIESVYTRKPRADKDKPRAIIRGMVNTDYYIKSDDQNQKQHRLARDTYNETQGTVLPTWKMLQVCFCDKVRSSDKARERINTYNERCIALVKHNISNIVGSKKKPGKHVHDARIVFAKRHNVKVALYAIIRVQGKQARIQYFNFESDVCEDKPYRFENNKVTQNDMVRLSRVKDRNIQIYCDKVV